MITEIIAITSVYDKKTTIPIEIRKRFSLNDGDKIVWGINKNGELVLSKPDTSLYNYL